VRPDRSGVRRFHVDDALGERRQLLVGGTFFIERLL
jgi:hypothetical protein